MYATSPILSWARMNLFSLCLLHVSRGINWCGLVVCDVATASAISSSNAQLKAAACGASKAKDGLTISQNGPNDDNATTNGWRMITHSKSSSQTPPPPPPHDLPSHVIEGERTLTHNYSHLHYRAYEHQNN